MISRRRFGLSALSMIAAGPIIAQGAVFFRIGTAGTGGNYYPIGALIADAISAPPGARRCKVSGECGVPGLVASAVSTGGSVENARSIQSGRLESGFVQADIANFAYTGRGGWTDAPAAGLRAIANLYPDTVHLVASRQSGIATVADIQDKRVAVGERDSGTLVEAQLLLRKAGLNIDTVQPRYMPVADAAQAMRRDEIDALFFAGGYPAPAISELASQIDIRFIPLERDIIAGIMRRYPFFSAATIPAATYEGQDQPVSSMAVSALWITSVEQPEALIHDITRAFWSAKARQTLAAGNPRGRMIQRETALSGISIPLHPGARRFYREIGMTR